MRQLLIENKNKIIIAAAVILSISAVVAITVLGGMIIQKDKDITSTKNSLKTSQTELSETKGALSQTEEGRKALEGIRVSLEGDKAKLSQDNSQLNQAVTKANEDLNAKVIELNAKQASLTKATNDLNAKQGQLTKTTSDLNNIQTQLAKAQRGVELFKSVESNFTAFEANINQAIAKYNLAADYRDQGKVDLAKKTLTDGDAFYAKAIANYNTLKALIAKFKTGNY